MYEQLSALDLSPAERAAYETLIVSGPMPPPALAKAAGLTRVNGYAALRGLSEKGLAEEKDINKKKVYTPAPPTKLHELAQKKLEQTKSQIEAVESLIPSLMNHYSLVSEQPGITHYEGLDGIIKIYEDSLRTPKHSESMVMRSIYDSKDVWPYLEKYLKRRAKLGVKNRTLSPPTDYRSGQNDKELLRESRFLPAAKFSLTTEISIYGDKVSLIAMKKGLIGTVIQNKDVADTFRLIFNLLWDQASERP
jgi:sugar-specific transcriptional regulator TrmB